MYKYLDCELQVTVMLSSVVNLFFVCC